MEWLRFEWVWRMVGIASLSVALIYNAHASIYQCKDERGKVVFKDEPCSSKESFVKQIEYKEPVLQPEEEQTPPLKVLYRGPTFGNETRFVRVSLVEETDEYVLLEVEGYFNGRPAGRMQFRSVPNMSWSYSGDVHTNKRGFVKAITRISLNSSAKAVEQSDILSLQLWHYSPENKATRFSMLSVPFKKTWKKSVK